MFVLNYKPLILSCMKKTVTPMYNKENVVTCF